MNIGAGVSNPFITPNNLEVITAPNNGDYTQIGSQGWIYAQAPGAGGSGGDGFIGMTDSNTGQTGIYISFIDAARNPTANIPVMLQAFYGAGLTSAVYLGGGAPPANLGSNGDLLLRFDGGAGTTIYQKRAGAWVGIL